MFLLLYSNHYYHPFITHTDKAEVDSSSRGMELSPFLCPAMGTRLLNTKKNCQTPGGKEGRTELCIQ